MQATTHTMPHVGVHEAHHEESGFWSKYIFSTDHKMIGIQYGMTALCFLLFGFCLMLMMRWQIAHPGQAIPLVGSLLEKVLGETAKEGKMSYDLYNSFGAMHGTIMVFMAIVPLAFAAFGNFVVPLQIGAPDMAFPRVNMASYQAYVIGGLTMFVSFFIPDGAAQAGWTSYSPLATSILTNGQTFWLIGMVCLITSSLLGAVNFIATIIQLRAPGMTWMRLPFFVWAQFVTAFLLLLAFLPLEAAGIMQLMDKVAHTSFFLPTGLSVGGALANVSGGGSPLLWRHLVWFLGPPGVYVWILPALGSAGVLFVMAFLPMFGIGGLTGLPLGFNYSDLHLHDTYYIIAHFHYIVAPGTIFALFAGIYYWFPKITGRMMSEFWGKVHFWTSLIFMNLIFQPMFAQGMAGMLRRMADGGAGYSTANVPDAIGGLSQKMIGLHTYILWAAVGLALAQIPFIINFFWSIKGGQKVTSDNPWDSTTLEWQTPTPPPHGNFAHPPQVVR